MSNNNQEVSRTVNIYIDQASAEKSLQKLQVESDKLTASIDKGKAAGKDMTAEIERLGKTTQSIETLRGQIDGKLAPSFNQLKQRVNELQRDLKKMSEDAPGYAARFKEYEQVKQRFDSISESIRKVGKAMDEEHGKSSIFEKISVIAGGVVSGELIKEGIDKLKEYVSEKIKANAELSDSLFEVADANKMSSQEVGEFNEELKKLDTRTPTEKLSELAIVAGQLDVKRENLLGFVEAADKITQTLGNKVGNASQFIKDITQEYASFNKGAELTGEELLKIGNAFQEMAGKGPASIQFVTGFTSKIMGMSEVLHISQGETYGLAAGLYNMGIRSEGAVAGIIKVMQQMGTDTPKYAKLAGMAMQDFADLMANKPVEALLKVTKALTDNNKNFGQISKDFKDAQDGGARVANTLALIGKNAESLAKSVEKGGEAMKGTEAITEAFEKKNNDLAGTLDKIGKKFKESWTSGAIAEGLNKGLMWFGKMIGAIDKTNEELNAFKEQKNKVDDLNASIVPLINRYEELKGKTNLNKDEQIELKEAISSIGNTIPSAITKFDEYGRAIDINADKARKWIDHQAAVARVMNADVIKKYTAELQDLNHEIDIATHQLNQRDKDGDIVKSVSIGGLGPTGSGRSRMEKMTDDEIKQLQSKKQKLQQTADDLKETISQLNGEVLKKLNEGGEKIEAERTGTVNIPEDKEAEAKEKKYQELVEKIKAVNREVAAMEKDALGDRHAQDELELQRIREKYAKMMRELASYGKKALEQIAELNEDMKEELELKQQEIFRKRSLEEYENSLADLDSFYQHQKQINLEQYRDNILDKQAFDNREKQLESDQARDKLQVAKDYAATVKVAAAGVEIMKTEMLKKGIAERDALEKQDAQDKVYAAQRKVLTSPDGSNAQLEAQKELLKAQYKADTQYLDKKSELYKLKTTQLNKDIESLEKSHFKKEIDNAFMVAGKLTEAASTYFNAQNQQLEQQLEAEKAASDAKMQQLQNELDGKRITQADYNKAVKEEKKRIGKEENRIKAEEFRNSQEMAYLQTVMNGAQGISEIWANYAENPVLAAILTSLETAVILEQLNTINQQKPPQNVVYERGGILPFGPSHADGGMKLISGGRLMGEIEGGEPILSRRTYANNKGMVDALLNSGGEKLWYQSNPARLNYERANASMTYNQMAYSGYGNTGTQHPKGSAPAGNKGSESDNNLSAAISKLNKHLDKGIKADVVFTDINKKTLLFDQLKKNSSFKQN